MAFASRAPRALAARKPAGVNARGARRSVARAAAEPKKDSKPAAKAEKPAASKPEDSTAKAAPKAEASKPAASASTASKERKAGPLQTGGTLQGEKAAGKDAAPKSKAAVSKKSDANVQRMSIVDGYFRDDRWVNGTWDFAAFPGKDGETDWNGVIDAEMERRRMLEESPIPSRNDDPVNFDTNMVPWWAWVKRFHLPEAEKLNGRAAMVGYLLAGVVDLASGAGLVEQQESFFGKLLLHITVFGILLIRSSDDIEKYKNLFDEATFYDKQWNATWEGQVRPSEQEKSK